MATITLPDGTLGENYKRGIPQDQRYPVPESPLIGRKAVADSHVYVIIRVLGNKRDRNMTPESRPEIDPYGRVNSVSCLVAELAEDGTLGPLTYRTLSMAMIRKGDHVDTKVRG